eukprot:11314078-Heterocapsa_arctica.AAC.1
MPRPFYVVVEILKQIVSPFSSSLVRLFWNRTPMRHCMLPTYGYSSECCRFLLCGSCGFVLVCGMGGELPMGE